MSTSTRFAACLCFHLCYITVVDSSILEHYLHVKHNETYANVITFSEFNPWPKSLSITGAESVIGVINSVLNGWSWETILSNMTSSGQFWHFRQLVLLIFLYYRLPSIKYYAIYNVLPTARCLATALKTLFIHDGPLIKCCRLNTQKFGFHVHIWYIFLSLGVLIVVMYILCIFMSFISLGWYLCRNHWIYDVQYWKLVH